VKYREDLNDSIFINHEKNSHTAASWTLIIPFLSGTYQNILFGCFNIGMQIWPIETLVLKGGLFRGIKFVIS
jgi:hypothetical protein